MTLTVNVCEPIARPEYVVGLVHATQALPSSVHPNVSPDFKVPEKPNDALVLVVDAGGVEVIVGGAA